MLLAGTYERFLFGFQLNLSDSKQTEQARLVRSGTYAAHQNAVKCVAAGGYFAATGGADDQIHLYDIKHNKDLGFLMNPGDGAVPCIQFYCPPDAHGAPSHMFSGSADGSIAVWQAGGQWQHLKLMKGHKSSVNSLTIHPTGRLAMSVAHDSSLRTWDLARGVSEFNTQLPHEADIVTFTPSGDAYVLVSGNKVTVHSAGGEGEVLAKLEHQRRVCSLAVLSDNTVIAGLEDGAIKVWDTRTSSVQLSQERAHATRIRGLTLAPSALEPKSHHHLVSASSDGVIKLWDIRSLGGTNNTLAPLQCLEEVATKARITCLAIANPQAPKAKAPQAPVPAPAATKPTAPAPGAKMKPVAGRGVQPGPVGKAKHQKGVAVGDKRGKSHPGFEIVSEEQQTKKQRQRQAMVEQDDEEADMQQGTVAPHGETRGLKSGTMSGAKQKVKPAHHAKGSAQRGPDSGGHQRPTTKHTKNSNEKTSKTGHMKSAKRV